MRNGFIFLNLFRWQDEGGASSLSSNSKCNTTGPDGLRCCHVVGAAFKEAGRLINEVLDQKSFYDSPVKIATRMIGDAKRLGYLQNLEPVGALALANLAQLAVSTKHKPLGSAMIDGGSHTPTETPPLQLKQMQGRMVPPCSSLLYL